MEDGPCDAVVHAEGKQTVNNGMIPTQVNNLQEDGEPPLKEDVSEEACTNQKLNGDSNLDNNTCDEDYSSESDALVIDESVPKKSTHKRKRTGKNKTSKKSVKETEVVTHSNPFFNESLYELAQQQQRQQQQQQPQQRRPTPPPEEVPASVPLPVDDRSDVKVNNCKIHRYRRGRNKSPKREYAQYLGLQPTVQFKCSKCGQAGFETLIALNDHIVQCDAIPAVQPPSQDNSSSSFKLTRKVFLCSACGTYYENWNLYLHMLELHRRFICLYCLGMFSAPHDLCQHIQSRHNLQPGHKNSLDEFFNVYSEPCYVVCCECNKLFSEEDNFFYHNCVKSGHVAGKINPKLPAKGKVPKVQIRPENHVTGDSGAATLSDMPSPLPAVDRENCDAPGTIKPNDEDHGNSGDIVNHPASYSNEGDTTQSTISESFNNKDGTEKQKSAESPTATKETDSLMPIDCQSAEEISDEDDIHLHLSSDSAREVNSEEEHLEDSKEDSCIENGKFGDVSQESEPPEHEHDIHDDQCDKILDYIPLNERSLSESKDSNSRGLPDDDNMSRSFEEVSKKIYENNEEALDNNEETDQFSDNELEDGGFTDNESTDNNEKALLDSSQDDADNLEHSEPEPNFESPDEHVETRKVPKLSLKLPKPGAYQDEMNDSEDSDKLTMEVDQVESENEADNCETKDDVATNYTATAEDDHESSDVQNEPHLQVAGSDVGIVELQLEQPLDKFDICVLLQKCLKATAGVCVYCNHSRKIAVNGKQLGLHAIAEHRYSAVVNSITAEELMPETFVARIKESLNDLSKVFFSLESGASSEGFTFSHVFECFQCRYSTTVHKELYLHNRKLHTKNLLLCIMCKSNFYSYSELICHLCPGIYVLDYDIQFRCCMCVSDDLPSAFRLMVHLRKRHHVCDVCLELCHNQYKLSNHVWKHKLHHFCYRCGIAYRNKPDITRHLFWKHGTESVLCKKCLQKKWPHVYHFCVPPTNFTCDECSLMFSRAVSLKVHKRLHTDEKPHACTVEDCKERFISKRLLEKHDIKHREPTETEKTEAEDTVIDGETENMDTELHTSESEAKTDQNETNAEDKPKPKVDVYDLPELNLSESDSDSEDETAKDKLEETPAGNRPDTVKNDDNILQLDLLDNVCETSPVEEHCSNNIALLSSEIGKSSDFDFEPSEKVPPILENIWDDFKNYQAEKEKIDHMFIEKVDDRDTTETMEAEIQAESSKTKLSLDVALMDHDYCYVSEPQVDTSITEVKPDLSQRVDHDYCSPKGRTATSPTKVDLDPPQDTEEHQQQQQQEQQQQQLQPKESPRKRSESTSSDSSSSDSSSCTCGSNCSCSSSGSSSSSSDSSGSDSSTEEGRKKQQLKRERRKEKSKSKKAAEGAQKGAEAVAVDQSQPVAIEIPIQESDLDTTESDTDEEFYDKQPQKLAKKILEEKRQALLAEVGTSSIADTWLDTTSRATTPSLPPEEEARSKKKSKSKKKKKRKSERRDQDKEAAEVMSPVSGAPPAAYYQCYRQQPRPPSPLQHHHPHHQHHGHQPPLQHCREGQAPPTVAPLMLTISRNSPVPSHPSSSAAAGAIATSSLLATTSSLAAAAASSSSPAAAASGSSLASAGRADDSSTRASKRRRVPNKFYGYSSDEEGDRPSQGSAAHYHHHHPPAKWRKTAHGGTAAAVAAGGSEMRRSPLTVPPITIKAGQLAMPSARTPPPAPPAPPQQLVEPLTIRPAGQTGELRVLQRQAAPARLAAPARHHPSPPPQHHHQQQRRHLQQQHEQRRPFHAQQAALTEDSASESNDSSGDEGQDLGPSVQKTPEKPPQSQLYCYCRCPYDEVSEMIGCDSRDCAIEWFHFECVGIMVPPKGQWFCPDCRKKKQQRRELL